MPSDRRFEFPTTARLKQRADFLRIYRQGLRVSGRHMVLFVFQGEGRFGVTASRKIGNAVCRNRSKRRLRELYRLHGRQIVDRPVDVVANARRSVASAPWSELEADFMHCLHRASRAARRGHRDDRNRN